MSKITQYKLQKIEFKKIIPISYCDKIIPISNYTTSIDFNMNFCYNIILPNSIKCIKYEQSNYRVLPNSIICITTHTINIHNYNKKIIKLISTLNPKNISNIVNIHSLKLRNISRYKLKISHYFLIDVNTLTLYGHNHFNILKIMINNIHIIELLCCENIKNISKLKNIHTLRIKHCNDHINKYNVFLKNIYELFFFMFAKINDAIKINCNSYKLYLFCGFLESNGDRNNKIKISALKCLCVCVLHIVRLSFENIKNIYCVHTLILEDDINIYINDMKYIDVLQIINHDDDK